MTSRVTLTLEEGMRIRAQNAHGAEDILDAAPPGGGGAGLTPMEFVLAALGACTAMDAISILRKKRQEVTDYRLEVEGVKADEHPKVYTAISVRHVFTGRGLSEAAVSHAIELSGEKYCSVMAMLRGSVQISTTFEIRTPEPVTIT
jgi:putative redox protein